MEQIVKVFKALADETRLKILIIVSKRNICAKGIAKHLNISEAAVSQHLKILKEASLIIGEKMGYYVKYKIEKSTLTYISSFIDEIEKKDKLTCYNYDLRLNDICGDTCKKKKNNCCHKNLRGD